MQMLQVLRDRHPLSPNAARDWFYFCHTVSHPAACFGTWAKFSCVVLTLGLLRSLNVCCCPSVMSSRCPHQQLAFLKEKTAFSCFPFQISPVQNHHVLTD